MSHPVAASIKVLTFDVFGTVVDWRSSVIAEGEQLGATKGFAVDWPPSQTRGGPSTGHHWIVSRRVNSRGQNSMFCIGCRWKRF